MARKVSGNAFAPKRPSSLSTSFAASEKNEEEEDEEIGTLNLVPADYARTGRKQWSDGGRSIGVAVSGTGGECATWIRKKVSQHYFDTALAYERAEADRPARKQRQ